MDAKPHGAPAIRLAKLGDVGANLYNSFHLLTQIAGLYAEAEKLEHHALLKVVFSDLAESAIADLGELYSAWSALVSLKQSTANRLDDLTVGKKIERVCLRLERATIAVNSWTPVAKLASLIALSESKWQVFAAYFSHCDARLAGKLTVLRSQSETRTGRLTGLLERLKKERDKMAEAARVEQAISRRGAFTGY